MRSFKMVLILVMLTVLSATSTKARDRIVDDLLIGTAIGGMIGYIVSNEQVGNSYGSAYAYGPPAGYHQEITYSHSPRRYYAPRHHYRDRYRDHYRSFSRSGRSCREIVVVKERYGHLYDTVKTVCRDRGDWHRPYSRDSYYDRWYGRHYNRW